MFLLVLEKNLFSHIMHNPKYLVHLKMKHFFIIDIRGRLMLLIQENVK